MRELYVEGVATRNDPESCGRHREVATEALTGASMGADTEPPNTNSGYGLVITTCNPCNIQDRHLLSFV